MLKAIMKLFFVGLAMCFLGGLGVLGLFIYVSFDLPQINSLAEYNPAIPSKIYSKDGHLLLEISKEKRYIAQMEEIPKKVVSAFLAAEDSQFYEHSGVNYLGIIRAAVKNIKAGRVVQGASTITQQVAKSLLLTSERTFSRKIKDFILAKRIEEKYSKEQILFLYLNQVYLGGGYYGVKAAFRGYFDKELSEATVAETALIAGLLVAPGRYSPYIKPKKAKARQRYVLGRLLKTEKISEQTYREALKEDIKIMYRRSKPMAGGYFTDWIRQRLYDQFGKDDFIQNGYEVVTTIDYELQKKAEEEVLAGVKKVDKRQGFKGPLESAEGAEQINKYIVEQRKKLYKTTSKFFIFTADGKQDDEYSYGESEYDRFLEADKIKLEDLKLSKWQKKYFNLGVHEDDSIIERIDFNKEVKAIVTKISDSQKIIYANYAGVKLAIPYKYYNWAHERKISIKRVDRPRRLTASNIVKTGDVVLVKIDDVKKSMWSLSDKDFHKSQNKIVKKNKKYSEFIKNMKEQKFYVAKLEQEPEVQGALLSISPETGEILAMVGGSSFKKSKFNRAVQAQRQPGSAFKPLIYAVGLENGYNPATILFDSPQALGSVDENISWKPRNYDGKFKGTMTYRRALEISRNVPTIRLTQDVGVKKVADFVSRLKLDVELPEDLSISLGSFGINLLNLVKMYSIFPNGGRRVHLKSVVSIKDRDGKVYQLKDEIIEEEPAEISDESFEQIDVANATVQDLNTESTEEIDENESEIKKEAENPFLVNLDENQVYDRRLAYIMTNILNGVVKHGTGRNARSISPYIGGKTGTTNDYNDAWFLGFSSKMVTGVWTGFDNNGTMGWGLTGGTAALPIWREFMRLGIQKYGQQGFKIPEGIVNVSINRETGEIAEQGDQAFVESFVAGSEPNKNAIGTTVEGLEESTEDVDSSLMDTEDYYTSQ